MTNPHLALVAKARGCPFAGPPSCGCEKLRRCRRHGRDVAFSECLACVRDSSEKVDRAGPASR